MHFTPGLSQHERSDNFRIFFFTMKKFGKFLPWHLKSSQIKKIKALSYINYGLFNVTRIYGAYGPIMFALRLLLVCCSFVNSSGFGDQKYVQKDTYYHVWKDTWHHVRKDTFWELCSEGHFLRIVFGRTLFENCVLKDTFWVLFGRTH